MATTLPRSFLYVPGNRPDLFTKASAGRADAVILDLEDAVPLPDKDAAREQVAQWLGGSPDRHPEGAVGPEQWVRIDPDGLEADLAAAVSPPLMGVFLAKCTLRSLEATAHRLGELEALRRPDLPPLRIVGLVESARGLTELDVLAEHPRLTTFGVGETDLLSDLRIARTATTEAMIDLLRTQIVIAAAASGISAPVAPTSTDFRDLDAFARSSRHLRDLGFRSRTAVHPGQVAVIHDVLTPGDSEMAAACDVLSRFEAAQGGVTTDADGRLIDAAVVRSARETVSLRAAADRWAR